MLLTITTTYRPATDIGHLLRKNPAKLQSFDLTFGRAHVYYPEATEEKCTAALLLEVDPVGLVRGRGPAGEGRSLEQYVNDRPYVASSFMSVAIAEVFGSALSGKSKDRPDLVETPLPLVATLSAVPCRGGDTLLRRLFEPLGYTVATEGGVLDSAFPDWGASPYFKVELNATVPLRSLLAHLYVLIPVLDNDKHYWVGDDEVEKLLRHGEGWLQGHPEKELIARRYLKHRGSLVRDALARLMPEEAAIEEAEETYALEEEKLEEKVRLNDQRMTAVVETIRTLRAKRVLDLGCGEGQLLRHLVKEKQIERILGLDVSYRVVEIALDRLRIGRIAVEQRERVNVIHGSLMYRDHRLAGFDAAAVVEVIEHLDPPRLAAFERVVFEQARPGAVIVTTPNSEYNVKWETLPEGAFRHKDHRFEWTRGEFQSWATSNAERFGYQVRFAPIGPDDPSVGPPTQMAIFTLPVAAESTATEAAITTH